MRFEYTNDPIEFLLIRQQVNKLFPEMEWCSGKEEHEDNPEGRRSREIMFTPYPSKLGKLHILMCDKGRKFVIRVNYSGFLDKIVSKLKYVIFGGLKND